MDGPVSPARAYRDNQEMTSGEGILASPFSFFNTYNISLFYLLWYMFIQHWNLANHVAWVRFNGTLLDGKPSPDVYLMVVVISEITLWLVGGPMFFYAAKYAKTAKKRYRFLSGGLVVMYVLTDIPLWLCDMSIVYYFGFIRVEQTTAWVLRSLSFLFGGLVVWHVYMHRVAKWLHQMLWAKRSDLAEIAQRQAKDEQMAQRRRVKISPKRNEMF